MKTRIFNLIIIDESGSMQFIKTAAIDSVKRDYPNYSFGSEETRRAGALY